MIIPKNISLKNWAASLVVDFPAENIPLLKGDDWKTWGETLVQEDSFAENGAPSTKPFDEWQKWAEKVFQAMVNF